MIHSGQWRFVFGHDRADGHLDAKPGDVVSVPTRMFRGFERIDDGTGFLWVELGGDDPGKVLWAPDVFELAERYGLKILSGGKLVDTTVGERVPPCAQLEPPPTPAEIAELATPPLTTLRKCAVTLADLTPNPASPIAADGIDECGIINLSQTDDGFQAGPITGDWKHGFALRLLRLAGGSEVAVHTRAEEEVVFVHSG